MDRVFVLGFFLIFFHGSFLYFIPLIGRNADFHPIPIVLVSIIILLFDMQIIYKAKQILAKARDNIDIDPKTHNERIKLISNFCVILSASAFAIGYKSDFEFSLTSFIHFTISAFFAAASLYLLDYRKKE